MAKYTADELSAMADKGHAMKNDNGDPSYPIADEDDLDNAIHAVGRGGKDHDAIRRHIIKRAKALKLADKIPDNWNADGSLADEKSAPKPGPGWTQRSDRTFDDTRQLVTSAISESLPKDTYGSTPYVWVVDLTDTWAVYEIGSGELQQVSYVIDGGGNVTLGTAAAVAQVTSYEPKTRVTALETRGAGDRQERERVALGRSRLYGMERAALQAEARGLIEPFVRCVRQMDPEQRVSMPFEMREVPDGTGGTKLRFSGYAAVVERAYEMEDMFGPYTETVARDAFLRTLVEGPDVNFLCNHGGVSMARTKPGTLKLSSDATGLQAEATLNPSRSDVQIVRAAVEDGDLDEMSFAFRCTGQEWDDDYENRLITQVSLHQGDVSIVNYGANPHTAGLVSLRSRAAVLSTLDALSEGRLFRALMDLRAGKKISGDTMNTLGQVLSLVSDADDGVDQAQILLSQLMGVPNPDNDDQWGDDGDDDSGDDDSGGGDAAASRSAPIPLLNYTDRDRQRLAALRTKKGAR